ncbi:MAG: fused MFS/spermidine synthase [Thermodesulfovibrio sp.]|nr:fused MFS/spermidine synthase [Thermodesulfovibrio sp.]
MGYLNLPPSATLRFAILVMGFTATASQILIIRELLIVFQGNELFIGVIFANWLIFQASGSYFIGKKAESILDYVTKFSLIQFATGIICPVVLLLIRAFRYLLNISTGEILGIHYVLLLSSVALFPVTFMGALFPLACRNLREHNSLQVFPAKVYLYESLGSFGAGIVFVTYFIYYLSSIEIALIILALNLFSVTLYLSSKRDAKTLRNLSLLLMILIVISFFISTPERLNRLSSALLWYEHPLVEARNSPYSNIAVIKREEQYTVFMNGSPYAVIPTSEILTEELAHFVMLFHEKPENVLVIGAGFGGLLEEISKYAVKKIDYAEPDPVLIETFNKLMLNSKENSSIHEKVRVHQREGKIFLRKTESLYDIILINLPMPTTLQMNRYYSAEFFKLAKDRLKEKGIFVLKLPGSEVFLPKELKNLNSMIYKTLNSVFPHVRIIAGDQNIFIASTDRSIKAIDEKMLTERLYSKNISSNIVNEWYLNYRMNEPKFKELERDITSAQANAVNQDIHPRAVFETMLFLNSALTPSMVKFLQIFEKFSLLHYLMFVSLIFIIFLIMQRTKAQIFLPFAIGSTGFMSMLVSILLILLFQLYYGYVYHYIGLLTSLFMLGSAFGAYLGTKKSTKSIVKVELGILILLCFLYIIVSFPPTAITQLLIFIAMTMTGLLTGVEFPLAVNISDSHSPTSKTSARFYAIDLLGAFFGALFPAIVLIPILGIEDTILITIALKSASFLLTGVYYKFPNSLGFLKKL